jgi:hypothetical protein
MSHPLSSQRETEGLPKRTRVSSQRETEGLLERPRVSSQRETEGLLERPRVSSQRETEGLLERPRVSEAQSNTCNPSERQNTGASLSINQQRKGPRNLADSENYFKTVGNHFVISTLFI